MKFIKNIKKYMPYARTTAWAELKSQVADSYLGWLWWILDPVLFMLVYTFIVQIVFRTTIENFPLFVFIGLVMWNFFSSTITTSVGIIRSYRSIFQKIYMPKYILIIVQLFVNLIKMLIGMGVSFIIILLLGINITVNILSLAPIFLVFMFLTFGISLFLAHGGVFIADLQNVTSVLIRLIFYLSGVFYTLDRMPEALQNVYVYICPTGFLLAECRNVMMYGMSANYIILAYWFAISLLLMFLGVRIMNKYENTYLKVI